MRIVVAQRLTMAHGVRGGMETQAQSLSEGLLARGHDLVTLTTPHPDGLPHAYEGSVPVRYISPGSWRRYQMRWWDSCYRDLMFMHQQQRCDILLSQSAGALGYIPRAAADLRLPCVVIIHGSITGEVRNRFRDTRSLRGIYRLVRHFKRLPQLLLLWKKAVPMVHHWIVVSDETANEWQREFAIPDDRLHVIVNGIDTTLFRPNAAARQVVRSRYGMPPDAPLLIAAGRLEYEKGIQLAVQAVRVLRPRFPSLRLLIAGDGVYRTELERAAAGLGDAVMFAGYVPNKELPELLAAADLFLMPTLRDEGLPMSALESLACGVPLVANRGGGVVNAIDDGCTGFLVPMGDIDALVAATERVLMNDTLRSTMMQAARNVAVARFSRESMVAETERVLLSC